MTTTNQNPISVIDRIDKEKQGDSRANRKIYTFVNTPLKRDFYVAIQLDYKNFRSETSNIRFEKLQSEAFLTGLSPVLPICIL